jgi:hypothetical protein
MNQLIGHLRVASFLAVAAASASIGCGGSGRVLQQPVVFLGNGANAASIQAQVDAFRVLLGANNGVGPATSTGRREVNWDAIPDTALDPFPSEFFVTTSPRGVRFTTPGTRLAVSGDPGSPSFKFANITAAQWGVEAFGFFSPSKIFAPIGSVITDVTFRVPGTQTPATVDSFGAVLTDVDGVGTSKVEFYDKGGILLLSYNVPPSGVDDQGLSFIGVRFIDGQRIARVRIFAGTHSIDTPFQQPPPEGAAIDDIIFSEPLAL